MRKSIRLIGLGLLLGVLSFCTPNKQKRSIRINSIKKMFPGSRIFYLNDESDLTVFYVLDSSKLYKIETDVDPINPQLSNLQIMQEGK